MSDNEENLIPASTIVLVREQAEGVELAGGSDNRLEVLLLRRNAKLNFAGGNWVFPGGRIDQADFDQIESSGGAEGIVESRAKQNISQYMADLNFDEREYAAALTAAVRETMEETALSVDGSELTDISHWVAPPLMKKRFTTWFFLGAIDYEQSKQVKVDGGEIHEARWLSPSDALIEANEQKINLLPPTLVTLNELAKFNNVASLKDYYQTRQPLVFRPHTFMGEKDTPAEGKFVFLYSGDAGYDTSDPSVEGERHRLEMVDGRWDYQNTVYH